MATKKNSSGILSGSDVERLASGIPSVVEQMAMAGETASSRAMRELSISGTLAMANLQLRSPIADMLAASNPDWLTSGILKDNHLSMIAESLKGMGDHYDWAKQLASMRWQHQFIGLDSSMLAAISGQQTELQKALFGISGNASAMAKALQLAQPNLKASVATAAGGVASLDLTSMRFAALAGITDLYGIGDLHRQTAKALLGKWHTDLTLPHEYWRNPEYRRALYREAEVDEGLIDADLATTVEISITSGAIVGEIIEAGRYVLGETATGLLTLTTANLASDIFELIGMIEKSLRDLISNKLQAVFGPKWFIQRVPGAVVQLAKVARQRALKSGEPQSPLIDFLTLGQLTEVVLRTDNWDNVFEPIFRNRDWFKRDVEVIGVARNPNAHYRANDSLRLTEALIVWKRLSSYIQDDGQWLVNADADE